MIKKLYLILILCIVAAPHLSSAEEYEGYYNWILTRPTDGETPYAEEVNGITHDDDHWFIGQNAIWHWPIRSPRIWKIPVTVDLANTPDCGVSVRCVYTRFYDQISEYDHVGGIDYYVYNGTGYLLLSLEGESTDAPPAVGILKSSDLSYVSHAILPRPPGWAKNYSNCSWVAIDPQGKLFTSANNNDKDGYTQWFSINWKTIAEGGELVLTYEGELALKDENGKLLDDFGEGFDGLGPQGGAITESGNLLYIVNGNKSDYVHGRDGISVFDMATGIRVAYSSRSGTEIFWYGFTPGTTTADEPEDLTIWDLDSDDRARPISGKLHVLLLNNDFWGDNVYLRHYSEKIHVAASVSGPGKGDPDDPFKTVTSTNTVLWDGSQLVIKSGNYNESVTINKRTRLIAEEGPVIIGE